MRAGPPAARADHVLVVDDDEHVRVAICRALRAHGYEVSTAADGVSARRAAEELRPDLILLDLGLPDIDGLRVCRGLRQGGSTTPIIAVTARSEVADRVEGLDAGADDYVVKPFALDELLARMRAVTRRVEPGDETALTWGDISLDLRTRELRRGERFVQLSGTEARLLEVFLRQPGQPFDRTHLAEAVWGYDFGPSTNPHEVYVGYLRRKLEAGGEPRVIHTVRGVGYVLRPA